MVTRVGIEEVKAIMEDYVDANKLKPFIKIANNLVNNHLVELTDNRMYSENELYDIELWLSAHFASATIYRMPYRREALDTALSYKMSSERKGLATTVYGETALELEHYGILKDLNKNRIVFNKL